LIRFWIGPRHEAFSSFAAYPVYPARVGDTTERSIQFQQVIQRSGPHNDGTQRRMELDRARGPVKVIRFAKLSEVCLSVSVQLVESAV